MDASIIIKKVRKKLIDMHHLFLCQMLLFFYISGGLITLLLFHSLVLLWRGEACLEWHECIGDHFFFIVIVRVAVITVIHRLLAAD
jgi:hypothetical protein